MTQEHNAAVDVAGIYCTRWDGLYLTGRPDAAPHGEYSAYAHENHPYFDKLIKIGHDD